MKMQRPAIIITTFRWSLLLVVLLFVGIQVLPHALGQKDQQAMNKRASLVESPSRPVGGTWTLTGSLSTGRFLHTATLLPSGLVLVAGGNDPMFHPTASA